jgi:hypothetical protein
MRSSAACVSFKRNILPKAYCKVRQQHISSAFYETVVGEPFVGGVWLFLRSMVYFIFLKKDFSLLLALGPAQHLIQ